MAISQAVTLEAQIACIEREIAMRERIYPRWIRDHKLLAATAEVELSRMRAVLETLRGLAQAPKAAARLGVSLG